MVYEQGCATQCAGCTHWKMVVALEERNREHVQEVCSCRDWSLRDAHVRTNHVHIVITAPCSPKRTMTALKAYPALALGFRQTGRSSTFMSRTRPHSDVRCVITQSAETAKDVDIIVGHCLAHSRRRFVEVTPNFPEECRFVLERFREVYVNDTLVREQNMTAEQRLVFHQTHSGPVMKQLKARLKAQFDERNVEPNSGLGVAITYLLKHRDRLTLFLKQPGAPLDNNIAERALKKAIRHRKNSLFYKTRNGARMGDLFMSLIHIHTCELCGVNPFDYLTELQQHAAELKANSSGWMPWNYRDTLQRTCMNVNSG